MHNKGYLQISFAWLFAIIVGAFILFFAIFFSTKLMGIGQYELDTKTAKDLGILLNPLETGFEVSKATTISLPGETRIYNDCDEQRGEFGRQIITISQKTFNKWHKPAGDVGFSNKYIFSSEYVEGKKFQIFSKPFDFPFKVSDVIYITSFLDKYCFKDAPEIIKAEIKSLSMNKSSFNLFVENCPEGAIDVCFDTGDCDINVDYFNKEVKKNNDVFYFEEDALMYGAIFSDKRVYECQVKRLMQRVENLGLLYHEKSLFISSKGCNSNLDLIGLTSLASNFQKSSNLASIRNTVDIIKDENEDLGNCKLW